MVTHICPKCGKQFHHKGPYNYHVYKMKRSCADSLKIPPHKNIEIPHKNNSVNFQCKRCNRSFTRKDNLTRHIRYFCKPKKYTSQLPSQIPSQTSSEHANQEDLDKDNSSKYMCNYCNKHFTRKGNLTRHLRQRCKIRMDIEKEKEEIYCQLMEDMELKSKELLEEHNKRISKLEEQNKKLQKKNNELIMQINNTTTHNTTNTVNNTQNNINIVTFGQEDLYSIFDEIVDKYLRKGYQSVPSLINHTHFDENRPELHNVYISNMKDVYAMVYDKGTWNLMSKQEVIDQLFDDKQCYLIEKFKEHESTLDDITKKKFGRFVNKIDDEIVKNIKHDIKLLLYNNRAIPMKTKKSLEKSALKN